MEIVTLTMSVSIGNLNPLAGQNENCWYQYQLLNRTNEGMDGFQDVCSPPVLCIASPLYFCPELCYGHGRWYLVQCAGCLP
jgi:hypothetical protein